VKKFIVPILSLIILLLGIFWWISATKPVSSDDSLVRFIIPKGRSASQVASSLLEEGLIKSPLTFRFYVQLTGRARKIQSGAYSLFANLSLYEIADQLTKGPDQVWVTIPEGLRREEIVERFVSGLLKEGEEEDTFRDEFLASTKGVEGYLFPDTYLFERAASAEVVVNTLRNTFEKKIGELESGIQKSGLSLSQIVILASIVERETITEDERPIVAGILLNRLAIGMGLQVDATVQYAVASSRCGNMSTECDWWKPPTGTELSVNSPYNTYKFAGLPIAPISNPGLSALTAVVSPEDSDYLYQMCARPFSRIQLLRHT